jgi:DNA-binding response OmpR family regulator
MKILVIEDETELQSIIINFLRKEGYVCESATNYKQAIEKISIYEYDVILLDITLPDGNGIELLKKIRKDNVSAGVIILSAKNSLDDKITGLDTGADDYITKPFQLTELNARIRAVHRRNKFDGSNIVVFNEITIDTNSNTVRVHDREIVLTRKELEMLLYFIINKNRVLTKEAIAEHLWSDNIDLADNFDFIYTHLSNLRRKIKEKGGNDYIKTIYGMGYKFADQ